MLLSKVPRTLSLFFAVLLPFHGLAALDRWRRVSLAACFLYTLLQRGQGDGWYRGKGAPQRATFLLQDHPQGWKVRTLQLSPCLLNPDAAQASRNLKSYKGGSDLHGEFIKSKG